MTQDPLTLYKLIVLYMLNRVTYPLTKVQIFEFFLENDYTNYLTLQQIIAELVEANLIRSHSTRNRTHLSTTDSGTETLDFFQNRINDSIRHDIHDFFKKHEYHFRNDVAIQADYYKSTTGEYEASLIAKEKNIELINIKLSVPTEAIALSICENWDKKNEEIYNYLVENLF